jgi:hypothetical protein
VAPESISVLIVFGCISMIASAMITKTMMLTARTNVHAFMTPWICHSPDFAQPMTKAMSRPMPLHGANKIDAIASAECWFLNIFTSTRN